MRSFFAVLFFTPCLLLAQAPKDTLASLSFGETFVVSQFFAQARVATNNAKAQVDTVALVAALGERLTKVLSDSTRKAVLPVNAFDRYFISRMLDQRGLQIPAPWANILLRIREKLGKSPIPPIKDSGKK